MMNKELAQKIITLLDDMNADLENEGIGGDLYPRYLEVRQELVEYMERSTTVFGGTNERMD